MSQQVNLSELYDAYKREDEIVVVEAGTYRLEVLRASVRPGQKGPGIMPVFKVLNGPYQGKTIMAGQFTASEAGRSIFFRQMAGFGLDENFWRQGNDIEAAAKAIVGRVVDAQITVRPWQGQDRNNIAIGGISLVSLGADPVAASVAAPAPVPAPQAVGTGVPGQPPTQQVAAPAAAPEAPPVAAPSAEPPAAAPVAPAPQPEVAAVPATTPTVPPLPPIPAGTSPF